jgi:hypothetical protein
VTIRGAMKAHDVLALEALADEILAWIGGEINLLCSSVRAQDKRL